MNELNSADNIPSQGIEHFLNYGVNLATEL